MRPADLDALVGIVDRCNEQMRAWAPGWEPPEPESERPGWRPRRGDGVDPAFVALDSSGSVIGAVLARVDARATAGHLRRLFVDPAHQQTGVGTRLLEAGEDAMFRGGALRATLSTPRFGPALAFYEARGWQATGPTERHERLGIEMVACEKVLRR